jgi:hypothetical protein
MPIDFPGLGPDNFGGSDDPNDTTETGWDRQMREAIERQTRYERAALRRECVCDRNPDTTDGPDIDCPEHGADACAAQREPQHVKRYAGPAADPRKPEPNKSQHFRYCNLRRVRDRSDRSR